MIMPFFLIPPEDENFCSLTFPSYVSLRAIKQSIRKSNGKEFVMLITSLVTWQHLPIPESSAANEFYFVTQGVMQLGSINRHGENLGFLKLIAILCYRRARQKNLLLLTLIQQKLPTSLLINSSKFSASPLFGPLPF